MRYEGLLEQNGKLFHFCYLGTDPDDVLTQLENKLGKVHILLIKKK